MEGAILKMPKGMFSATFGDGRAKGPENLRGCARHLVKTDAVFLQNFGKEADI